MLIALHRVLRRQRRLVLPALAVAALAAGALTVQSALMSDGMGHHMTNGAALCLAVGGCAFIVVGAAAVVRRLAQRPLRAIPAPPVPTLAFVPVSAGFLVRAGPPPLLQVFRL